MDIVKYGLKIDFIDIPPTCKPFQPKYSDSENKTISAEIKKLLDKKVIVKTNVTDTDYFSSVFVRPKPNQQAFRMILNLKKLNSYVFSPHFKMESIKTARNMIRKNMWMASVDLKDAYYTVPIHPNHQKYLKFLWKVPYKFVAMPNGYSPAMLKFTKLLKPPFAKLREMGHSSVVYVDDNLLTGDSLYDCYHNITETTKLLTELGFTIHLEKSILIPTQEITFLGFIINSKDMTIRLTPEKKDKIVNLCSSFKKKTSPSIRELASVIGNLVAAMEAVPYGKLHYRQLEKDKILALSNSNGIFEHKVHISDKAIDDLDWWIENVHQSKDRLNDLPVDLTIHTDASSKGWGATNGTQNICGPWEGKKIGKHINILELYAAKLAVMEFKSITCSHIRIMMDNTTAIAYINNMGGIKSHECNEIAKSLWEIVIADNIWISAAHIPGKDNVIADYFSRNFECSCEWEIPQDTFNDIMSKFGKPTIDMFASRHNNKLTNYVSWKADTHAFAIDAFNMSWNKELIYCFPPFSLIGKVLKKMDEDKAEAIMIVPQWSTQTWYTTFLGKVIKPLMILPSSILRLPGHPQKKHPLAPKLSLIVGRLSADSYKIKDFQNKLPKLSSHLGDQIPMLSTKGNFNNGNYFVFKNMKIPCYPR